jgi:hypothetical protein
MSSAHQQTAVPLLAPGPNPALAADASIRAATNRFAEHGPVPERTRLALPRVPLKASTSRFAATRAQSLGFPGTPADEWLDAAYSMAFLAICWGGVEVAIFMSTGHWWNW